MTLCTLNKRLCCFIDLLDTTFRKVNCVVRLEVDIVKNGIFFPIDLIVELSVLFLWFCFQVVQHNHWFACGYFSSNQEACNSIGFSESHNRCFWEDVIVLLVWPANIHEWSRSPGTRLFIFFYLYSRSYSLETKSALQKPLVMFSLLYLLFLRWYHSSLSLFLVFLFCWVNAFHSDSLAVADDFVAVYEMTDRCWEILMFVKWFVEYYSLHFSICAVVAVWKNDILVWDISLMNLMD